MTIIDKLLPFLNLEHPGSSKEVVRGSFNAKCDVWSLGCCLYALLCHRPLRLEDHLKEGSVGTPMECRGVRWSAVECRGVPP